MHAFTEYIQPLTAWLHQHPSWALLITFLISFSESLAVIGSIIPGSITMTAIGILAGSGAMRIDLTFLAAITGAVAGDSSSYAIGYICRDSLITIWPFKKYPGWLNYGKEYFSKYGAASVLIGRFVGPIRSIIPVIAGMMHMKHWHFLFANIVSAIAWSALYLGPGILIGEAGSELSAKNSKRLFVIILIAIAAVWLLGLTIKYIIIHAHKFLHKYLRFLWASLENNMIFSYLIKQLAPQFEQDHYYTARLIIITMIFLIITVLSIAFNGTTYTNNFNINSYYFFQNLNIHYLNKFFIKIDLITSPKSLLISTLAFSAYIVYDRYHRALYYFLSTNCISMATIMLLNFNISAINKIQDYPNSTLFLDPCLTLETASLSFIVFYIITYCRTMRMIVIRNLLAVLLCIASVAPIYLGKNWASNIITSYFIGFTVCLVHWIFYRKNS